MKCPTVCKSLIIEVLLKYDFGIYNISIYLGKALNKVRFY